MGAVCSTEKQKVKKIQSQLSERSKLVQSNMVFIKKSNYKSNPQEIPTNLQSLLLSEKVIEEVELMSDVSSSGLFTSAQLMLTNSP